MANLPSDHHFSTAATPYSSPQAARANSPAQVASFDPLIEHLPLAAFVSRLVDGEVVAQNHRCREQISWSSGTTIVDILGATPHTNVLLDTLKRTHVLRDREIQISLSAHHSIWMSVSAQVLDDVEPEGYALWILHEVTAHRMAQTEFANRAQQQAVVAQLGQEALIGIHPNGLIEDAVSRIAQILDVPLCGVFEVTCNGFSVTLKAGVGWKSGLVGNATLGTQSRSYAGYILQALKPLVIEDLRVETRIDSAPLLHNHRVVSSLSVIIPGQDYPFGILCVHTLTPRYFSDNDVHFVQAIANILATAINRKKSDDRLRLMERAIAASSNGIVITDPTVFDNPVIYANPAVEQITGYSFDELIGRNCRFLQGPETDHDTIIAIRNAIQKHEDVKVTVKNYRKDGKPFWNDLSIAPVFDSDGYLVNFIGIQTDITEKRLAADALKQERDLLKGVIQTSIAAIAVLDASGQVIFMNDRAEQLLGQNVRCLVHCPEGDDRVWTDWNKQPLSAEELAVPRVLNAGTPQFDIPLILASDITGQPDRYLSINAAPLHDANGCITSVVASVTDVTERLQMEAQLHHDALHDVLTGLPNRALFQDRLRQAIARSTRDPDRLFAVLFLDLDRFKVINDSLGHAIGDLLLVSIANRLNECLRPGDTVARLGGDEFTVLLDNLLNQDDAMAIADRIHQVLSVPFYLDGHEVFTSASIGITFNTEAVAEPDDLLRDADMAMYRAKEQGRAGHAVFSNAMYDHAVTKLQNETDLRRAIERQELSIHYQPIVSLKTGQIHCVEALARWEHPQRGVISPADFIPIAEETGLIIPLGLWVLEQACQHLHHWLEKFPHQESLSVAVNISAKQFSQPDLPDKIDQILHKTGVSPQNLKLELTESGIMENAESAFSLLQELKAHQISIGIDDFGTGYSSLSRLHAFPIDTVKIDRSFIQRSGVDQDGTQIVQAMLTLAHTLGMTVVAEGIETPGQLTYLQSAGCDYGQGYLFAKALTSADFEALLANPSLTIAQNS